MPRTYGRTLYQQIERKFETAFHKRLHEGLNFEEAESEADKKVPRTELLRAQGRSQHSVKAPQWPGTNAGLAVPIGTSACRGSDSASLD